MNSRRKVLVCGATGFIGRNVAESLARDDRYLVVGTHHRSPPFAHPRIDWIRVDLRNPEAVERAVEGMDVVIQAAATTSGARDIVERPSIHVTDNAVMNAYLLRAASERGVKQFVFFSCTVMYPSSPVPQRESDWDPGCPIEPRYFAAAHTKMYIERMCEFYAGVSPCAFTVIRHTNIFGPYDKFELARSHVLGATVSKVMTASDRVTVWGTGAEARDVLYVEDLVRFVELALDRQPLKHRLYNCGSGRAVPVADLVAHVIARSGRKLRIEYDATKPTIPTSLCLDCSLAAEELGWAPRVSLDEGLDRTLAWWRQNIDPVTMRPWSGQT